MKRRPKIKKYYNGGSEDGYNVADPNRKPNNNLFGNNQNLMGNQNSGFYSDGYSGKTYNNESSGLSSDQKTNIAAQAGMGAFSAYNTANDSSLNSYEKNRKYAKTEGQVASGVLGAFNPLLGMAAGAAYNIGDKQRTSAERTDEQGNLVNKNKAKGLAIAGAFADPISAIQARSQYKGGFTDVTGEGYANWIEQNAKADIEKQKEQEQQYNQQMYTEGGIHIKPENKGKFTAYKERTGKTTEEALHSPNAHVRQMANFARNAAKWKHADGGIHEIPANAELEKQEMFQTPDGSIDGVDAPSHSNGGVQLNIPEGTQILSDRLKMPGTKKTFAKLGAKYDSSKEDKILEDTNISSTKKSSAELIKQLKKAKFDELFQTQEQLKQEKLNNYAKRIGMNSEEFAYGGKVPKYWDGGPNDKSLNLSNSTPDQEQKNYYDNIRNPMYTSVYDENYMTNPNIPNGLSPDQAAGRIAEDNYDFKNKYYNNLNNNSSDPNRKSYDWTTGLGTAAAAAPYIYSLIKNNKYDKENYGQVTPNLLDNSEALNTERQNYLMNKKDIKELGQGNAQSVASNYIRNKSASTMNRASIIENFNNQNAIIKNDNAWRNKELNVKQMNDTSANKARMQDQQRLDMQGLSNVAQSAMRDYRAGRMDKASASMISDMFTNYKLDMNNPDHWKWVFQQIKTSGK